MIIYYWKYAKNAALSLFSVAKWKYNCIFNTFASLLNIKHNVLYLNYTFNFNLLNLTVPKIQLNCEKKKLYPWENFFLFSFQTRNVEKSKKKIRKSRIKKEEKDEKKSWIHSFRLNAFFFHFLIFRSFGSSLNIFIFFFRNFS